MKAAVEEEVFFDPKTAPVKITVQNLSVVYKATDEKNQTVALKDVNLDIKDGEFISLVGPSGCGKTTLLRVISGLIPSTSGKVFIGGLTPQEARVSKEFGIVFQSPVLMDWRTIRRNICLPLELMKMPKPERTKKVDEMLDIVGLKDFGYHYPRELSGGMQQRVGIARALALNPNVLFMDEPFSALDEFTKERLHEDLLRIWRKTHKTIIFVTHNIQEAVFLSDRVVVFSPHPGRITSVVDIDIPRPRSLECKNTQHFTDLVAKVRSGFEGV
ncbi:ABC transporter ATP-binding protein [uncultured Treponema sp.]|uniref:ABC transporter ATP-binding protein n=1 Tax=Treponema sp. TaxID=166 RepID=UPI00298E875A|nr:ABC transporter ATP-binding protein [uncultured Treponema sp.]